jgi:hypothetical protein
MWTRDIDRNFGIQVSNLITRLFLPNKSCVLLDRCLMPNQLIQCVFFGENYTVYASFASFPQNEKHTKLDS